MSELSPAAQAVLDAFVSNAGEGHRHQSGAAAAALRAAADHLDYIDSLYEIATELEDNDHSD